MSELTPEQLRLRASCHDLQAALLRMQAGLCDAATAIRQTNAYLQAGYDRAVATHPDLAELNVMMDSYYGTPA